MLRELEDVDEGNEKIWTDTSNDDPYEVNCMSDDERIYVASSDDTYEKKCILTKNRKFKWMNEVCL